MFNKRARAYGVGDLPPAQRLRHNIADLFAANSVSGVRAQELFNDAVAAGDVHSQPLRGQSRGHEARDLRRRLMKHNMWPASYQANCRVWNPKLHREEVQSVNFLLPHEIIGAIAKVSQKETLLQTGDMDPRSLLHLRRCEEHAGERLLAVGLWGDGAPCNWDRTESIEIFTINLPGLSGRHRNIRVLLCGLSKKHFVTTSTYNDLLAIISWSFQCLAAGVHPATRHDNTPWGPGDVSRKRHAGQAIGVRGALVEVRGDWKFMKECFGFPGWTNIAGICWQCSCTPATLRDVTGDAAWRHERLGHWDVIQKILNNNVEISPIFTIPWIDTSIFRPDWLHAVDQGVAADFLGNFLYYLVKNRKVPGNTEAARCTTLWSWVLQYYDEHNVQDRLQNLTMSMLCKSRARSPKLRSSAAQCRALVPFAVALAMRPGVLNEAYDVEIAMRAAAQHLHQCYEALSSRSVFWEDVLRTSSRRFAAQYVALEEDAGIGEGPWKVKPKMHMFLELCSDGSRPSLFWTYRDEDFGGSCAAWARRRGGLLRAGSTSATLLSRFKLKSSIPRIV